MALRKSANVILLASMVPFSEALDPFYDPKFCYILDGFLLIYGIIITAFFVRERFVKTKSKEDKDSAYEPLKTRERTYDELEAGQRGRRRGNDDTYTPLGKRTEDTYREIPAARKDRRRTDQVYQGLSSVTKDTYDSLQMQSVHPSR